MARKVIDYDEWSRTRTLVEARARRILSFFDMEKLQRKPRATSKDAWLKAHDQGSPYAPAPTRPKER